jgi:hypothetical protein
MISASQGVPAMPEYNEAGCHCGRLRYVVRGRPFWQAGCCCRSCVKIHSAPYVVWAGFSLPDIDWLKGKPQLYESSPHILRSFCGHCSTSLTYQKDGRSGSYVGAASDVVYVSVPTLDHPELFPPHEVVRGDERIPWLDLGEKIPVHSVLSPEFGSLQTSTKLER